MSQPKILAFLCISAIIVNAFTGCKQTAKSYPDFPETKSIDDTDWDAPEETTLVLKNDHIRFELDTATTHFIVTDLVSGKRYSSVPEKEVSSYSVEDQSRLCSELTATYYEEQSTAEYMYSDADSVRNGNFKVLTRDNTVRIYYTLGATADDSFVPPVFAKDVFETDILGAIGNPNATRRLSRYYTLYETKDSSDDYNEQMKRYPVLKTIPLYILTDELSDMEKEEITEFMDEAGYTREQYESSLEKLNMVMPEPELKAGFTVPVEYSINCDGFSAKILSDRITENSTVYKLQKLDLLEYFASSDNKDTGYYVLPDGCGSLININGRHQTDFSQPFFGQDYSIQSDNKNQLAKNLMLPVFGISQINAGMLAIVEQAAENALLNVKTMSNTSPQNHIFVSFTMRNMDATDIGKRMQIPVYNLFSKHLLRVSPTIRYVFLKPGQSDYVGMASYYRDYLLRLNKLKRNDINGEPPLYLDYLCMLTQDASFLGFHYKQKVVLSTISEITKTVRELQAMGVNNLSVRLVGYGAGGLANKANNEFNIDHKVGTIQEAAELKKLLERKGGHLYVDADFQFVYNSGNGFTPKEDSAHYLNRELVYTGYYDRVTRKYDASVLPRYFVSSGNYMAYADSFLTSLKNKCKTDDLPGLSYGTSGLYLGGDYTPKKDFDRSISLFYLEQVMDNSGSVHNIMFDNGNGYVLPYAAALVNTPLYSSRFDIEFKEIPFYQLVIHGIIPYSGAAMNLSQNPSENFLRSLEYGAFLSSAWITRDNSLITNTDYSSIYYSLNDQSQLDSIVTLYKRAKEYWKSTKNVHISKHEQIAEQVFRTTYKNGIEMIVNYGDTDKNVNGISVGANNFVMLNNPN